MLNLLSVGWMLTKGWECHFRGGPSRCNVSYRTSALGSVPLQNNLCFLDLEFLRFDEPLPILWMPTPLTAFARITITHDLWHAHLGHVGGNAARRAARFADGVVITSSVPLSVCESCVVGKHPRKPFHPSENARSTGFLDLVHADVAGPMPVHTPHGRCYFLVILDDFTHTLDLHLLTTKDQALDAWESTRRHWETKFSRHVKEFQSDNGGKFINSAFISALDAAGISHRLSVPYMHQQNGIAEWVICTIEGRLLAMLHLAGLPQTYWGEAALTAAYLHNRTELCALPPGQTPYEMLYGQCPNLSHLRVWGCCAFAHIPLEMQAKLGPKSWEVLFMGYPPGVKGWSMGYLFLLLASQTMHLTHLLLLLMLLHLLICLSIRPPRRLHPLLDHCIVQCGLEYLQRQVDSFRRVCRMLVRIGGLCSLLLMFLCPCLLISHLPCRLLRPCQSHLSLWMPTMNFPFLMQS